MSAWTGRSEDEHPSRSVLGDTDPDESFSVLLFSIFINCFLHAGFKNLDTYWRLWQAFFFLFASPETSFRSTPQLPNKEFLRHKLHSLWRLEKALDSSQPILKYTFSSVYHWLGCFSESPLNPAHSLLTQLVIRNLFHSSLLRITEPQLMKHLQDMGRMLEIPGRIQIPRNLVFTLRHSYAGLCCRWPVQVHIIQRRHEALLTETPNALLLCCVTNDSRTWCSQTIYVAFGSQHGMWWEYNCSVTSLELVHPHEHQQKGILHQRGLSTSCLSVLNMGRLCSPRTQERRHTEAAVSSCTTQYEIIQPSPHIVLLSEAMNRKSSTHLMDRGLGSTSWTESYKRIYGCSPGKMAQSIKCVPHKRVNLN